MSSVPERPRTMAEARTRELIEDRVDDLTKVLHYSDVIGAGETWETPVTLSCGFTGRLVVHVDAIGDCQRRATHGVPVLERSEGPTETARSPLAATQACQEIVHGRRCRHRVIEDPRYFEMFPEREHLRGFCGLHRNLRVRAETAPVAWPIIIEVPTESNLPIAAEGER